MMASINHEESPFLTIPGEIRNQIYRYLLVSDETIDIQQHPEMPALLSTNQQLRAEASSIYWGENTFQVTDSVKICPVPPNNSIAQSLPGTGGVFSVQYTSKTSPLREYLERLGPERASMIAKMRILYDDSCERPPLLPQDMTVSHFREERKQWKPENVIESNMRGAAKVMVPALMKDGLRLESLEAVGKAEVERSGWAFQIYWPEAVEEVRKTMNEVSCMS